MVIAFSFLLLALAFFAWRNYKVQVFRSQLLNEETNWLNEQTEDWFMTHFSKYTGLVRYDILPGYDIMLYKFWIPLNHYKKNLKALKDCYPGIEYQI